ncbi:MAG: hypothetical protein A2946_02940 [Candidatus Liptonbacteria bacterium RIFCSPLOWO2_01_FULL_53_13]|uniref:Transcriptional regulator n=1 Tax=Candidatus Liptonbacteria bacterium RIFCSPLOWO2_01_FULL_53_13 TaxID=1798651 RepID=A0A1G2CKD6_9BACT|nr:MAG: hypothetical protein A2946_02940 [Candidatus Liptonbacteria bacterium RIFCSPLOWO2_01_FULL_53_13]
MSGHSHWAGIKHQKGIADQKRGRVFSKLLALIAAAAKTELNPDFNPRLRTAIAKARAEKVPSDNIERAIVRAKESADALEELTFEAYGPGGAALFIEAITDNKNRAIQEIKKVLADNHGKWAEVGSVAWAFTRTDADQTQTNADSALVSPKPGESGREWKAKFPQALPAEDKLKLDALVAALEEQEDVQRIYTNAQ